MYLRSYLNSQSIMAIINDIVHSDFIEAMRDGTLEDDKFKYYLVQDHVYLKYYKEAGSRIQNTSADEVIRKLYTDIGSDEPQFHRDMLLKFNVDGDSIKDTDMNYTTYSYINHLIRWSRDSDINGMLAMFPCQWSYGYIAEAVAGPEEKFKFWFDFYRSAPYRSITDRYLAILGEQELDEYQEQIIKFGLEYELNYWIACYI
ncbi:TenA family protein [Ferroplasma sp.]|uniref:TenA family protein n=1 Tax=Ferroplasma sp. TaxID=2591003 RepID=UPI00261B6A43|nr:TenA family protein [Ferroplasma sp.]MCL4453070.1 TenA family protein [Candidatus Thermoplasmatota archaeon]